MSITIPTDERSSQRDQCCNHYMDPSGLKRYSLKYSFHPKCKWFSHATMASSLARVLGLIEEAVWGKNCIVLELVGLELQLYSHYNGESFETPSFCLEFRESHRMSIQSPSVSITTLIATQVCEAFGKNACDRLTI